MLFVGQEHIRTWTIWWLWLLAGEGDKINLWTELFYYIAHYASSYKQGKGIVQMLRSSENQ